MQSKENGFIDFFTEKSDGDHIMVSKTFNSAEENIFKHEVSQFIKDNPKINAFFVTNSKAYMLVEAFQDLKKDDSSIIGYDLLKPNIKYLKQGNIKFLIHQKPKRQAFLSVNYLAEHFLFGKPLPAQEFLPIDIITTENAHYYL